MVLFVVHFNGLVLYFHRAVSSEVSSLSAFETLAYATKDLFLWIFVGRSSFQSGVGRGGSVRGHRRL